MPRYWIGLDDTDNAESIGTGALARELMLALQRQWGVIHHGITRHQLLVHPDIAYTSHNSAACLEIATDLGLEAVAERVDGFVEGLLHEGADPAWCVAPAAPAALDPWLGFGRRCQREVVARSEAAAALGSSSARTLSREVGGDGSGIIGAIAACGLRSGGDDGRFIALPGLRALEGTVRVREILGATAIERVVTSAGEVLGADEEVDTLDWVRPDLRRGRIELRVRRGSDGRAVVAGKDKKLDKH